MDEWMNFKGKKVFLRVIPNRQYQAHVIAVVDVEGKKFLKILDHKGFTSNINVTEILVIQEEK